MRDPSLVRFRRVIAAACDELERRRQEVNDLNVFPVPDGDTGDNMAMTMRAVLEELDALAEESIDTMGRDRVVHAVARAALLGARGNSGVILSQIVRGAAEELISRPGELVDPVLVAAAFARASDAAYESVRDPAEGTMLTAVRAMAHRVAQDLAHMDKTRLGPDSSAEEQDALIAEVLERALEAGSEAVRRGPDQLRALRDAGVVDAGAYGLTVIVAGVLAALSADRVPELAHQSAPVAAVGSLHADAPHESSLYRYCVNFAVTGVGLDGQSFVPPLEALGDSVLVVGDEETIRVHVHTDEPQQARALFDALGDVSRFDVADMREQEAARHARLRGGDADAAACGIVAVATGEGIVALYESEGAVVVDPGAKMNPSTQELLAAINSSRADEVVVLPNSANVVMTAERAAELAERPARVVATRTPQEGLAALVAFDPGGAAARNAESIWSAVSTLATGGVAPAARDDARGRFRRGDAVGYAGSELVAWGDPADTLRRTVEHLAADRELVTCIAGAEAPFGRDEVERAMPGELDLDFHEGGQPAWWWLLAAE